MNTLALTISIAGFLIMLIGISFYFSSLIKNKVPVVPVTLFLSLIIGVTSGVYSFYLVLPNTLLAVLPIAIPATLSIFMASFFIFVFSQKKTPIGDIKVNVGDSVLPFETKNSKGELFSTSDLKGQRTLLKFYRGAWCPYCSRELSMFEEMKTIFDQYNVKVIALSGDNTEQAAGHIQRDNLSYTLLSDPELAVVKLYGVEHHKSFGADSDNIMTVFGLPFPKPYQFKFKSMSIPTSILIDENGVIQWIDQSEDYRLRASQDRIVEALEKNFGKAIQ